VIAEFRTNRIEAAWAKPENTPLTTMNVTPAATAKGEAGRSFL